MRLGTGPAGSAQGSARYCFPLDPVVFEEALACGREAAAVGSEAGPVPATLTRRQRAIPQSRGDRSCVAQMHVEGQEASTRTRLGPEEAG